MPCGMATHCLADGELRIAYHIGQWPNVPVIGGPPPSSLQHHGPRMNTRSSRTNKEPACSPWSQR